MAMVTPDPAATDHRPRRERRSRTSASTSSWYLRSSTIGAAIPTAASAAADGSRGKRAGSASPLELSTTRETQHAYAGAAGAVCAIEARPVTVASSKPRAAARMIRTRDGWSFDLHLRSSLVDIELDRALRSACGLRPLLLRADRCGAGTLLAPLVWFTAPGAEEPQGEG
jgi:hypothetical protein